MLKNNKLKRTIKNPSSPRPRRARKKEFIFPLYFGWEIAVRRVKDLRKHIVGPFKKYWQYMTVVVILMVIVSAGFFINNYYDIKASTFSWTQTDWTGGVDGGSFPDHTDNKTNWTKYSAVDSSMATTTSLSLVPTASSITETTDADFNAGDKSDSIYVGSDTVYPEKPNTYACEDNNDNICQSGRCDTTCQAKLADGQACDEASDCSSGECQGSVCVGPCDTSTACGTFCAYGGFIYGTVSANNGCWLDRNLGATQVATAYNDSAAYGDLYQWGRLTDGHQIRTSGTTGTNSGGDVPGHANFITEGSSPYDWRVPQNNNLWGSAGGYLNNPCPAGWHVPTQTEWASVVSALGITNYTTAASLVLHLPASGGRYGSGGSLGPVGSSGNYWSSSIGGTNAYNLFFSSGSVNPASNNSRAYGFSVRCLKN